MYSVILVMDHYQNQILMVVKCLLARPSPVFERGWRFTPYMLLKQPNEDF